MLEIKIYPTDQTFVGGLSSADIEGVKYEYRRTMSYDSAEHMVDIIINVATPVVPTLVKNFLVERWQKKAPEKTVLHNQVVNNDGRLPVGAAGGRVSPHVGVRRFDVRKRRIQSRHARPVGVRQPGLTPAGAKKKLLPPPLGGGSGSGKARP